MPAGSNISGIATCRLETQARATRAAGLPIDWSSALSILLSLGVPLEWVANEAGTRRLLIDTTTNQAGSGRLLFEALTGLQAPRRLSAEWRALLAATSRLLIETTGGVPVTQAYRLLVEWYSAAGVVFRRPSSPYGARVGSRQHR